MPTSTMASTTCQPNGYDVVCKAGRSTRCPSGTGCTSMSLRCQWAAARVIAAFASKTMRVREGWHAGRAAPLDSKKGLPGRPTVRRAYDLFCGKRGTAKACCIAWKRRARQSEPLGCRIRFLERQRIACSASWWTYRTYIRTARWAGLRAVHDSIPNPQ